MDKDVKHEIYSYIDMRENEDMIDQAIEDVPLLLGFRANIDYGF